MNISLLAIQGAMAKGLLHHQNEEFEGFFAGTEAELNARISVYRNNIFYSLTNALADLYPVVQQIVGEEFFRALANRYVRNHPPAQAAMVYFGREFSNFLDEDKACAELLYLPDVARFELARQRAYHAADVEALTPEAMQNIGVEHLLQSCPSLHPSLQQLDSKWAVRSIWLEHKAEKPKFEGIDTHQGQQTILVRPAYEVLVCAVDSATLALIGAISEGNSLQTAIENTLEKYPELDVAQSLALGFGKGFFTEINFPQD